MLQSIVMKKSGVTVVVAAASLLSLASFGRGAAPNAAAQNAPSGIGAEQTTYTSSGVRLEGKAFIHRPDLDVTADVIALDRRDTQITQVRARGNVNLKLNLPPREGGAPARIEATCALATLEPATRTLVLTGGVDGFYQVRGGARNTLRGEKATLRYSGERQLTAQIEGGTSGVRIVVPGDAFVGVGGADAGDVTNLGAVTITANRALINESDGTARLVGNARAVSADGPNAFEMSAAEFVLSRDASGVLNTLKTSGRTRLRFDLPPSQAPGAAKPKAGGENKTRPNQNPATPTPTAVTPDSETSRSFAFLFEGNVEGFYRFQAAGAAAQDYPFNGDRADVTIKYIPEEEAAPVATAPDATAPDAGAANAGAPSSARRGGERPTRVEVSADGVTMRRVAEKKPAVGASGRLKPDLKAVITGKPSTIKLPNFDLGF